MKIEIDLMQGDADLFHQALQAPFNPHREIHTIEREDVFDIFDHFIMLKNEKLRTS